MEKIARKIPDSCHVNRLMHRPFCIFLILCQSQSLSTQCINRGMRSPDISCSEKSSRFMQLRLFIHPETVGMKLVSLATRQSFSPCCTLLFVFMLSTLDLQKSYRCLTRVRFQLCYSFPGLSPDLITNCLLTDYFGKPCAVRYRLTNI